MLLFVKYSLSKNYFRAICVLLHEFGDHIQAYEDVAKSLQKNHNIAVHGYDQGKLAFLIAKNFIQVLKVSQDIL